MSDKQELYGISLLTILTSSIPTVEEYKVHLDRLEARADEGFTGFCIERYPQVVSFLEDRIEYMAEDDLEEKYTFLRTEEEQDSGRGQSLYGMLEDIEDIYGYIEGMQEVHVYHQAKTIFKDALDWDDDMANEALQECLENGGQIDGLDSLASNIAFHLILRAFHLILEFIEESWHYKGAATLLKESQEGNATPGLTFQDMRMPNIAAAFLGQEVYIKQGTHAFYRLELESGYCYLTSFEDMIEGVYLLERQEDHWIKATPKESPSKEVWLSWSQEL